MDRKKETTTLAMPVREQRVLRVPPLPPAWAGQLRRQCARDTGQRPPGMAGPLPQV